MEISMFCVLKYKKAKKRNYMGFFLATLLSLSGIMAHGNKLGNDE